jgi:hypothetical protein
MNREPDHPDRVRFFESGAPDAADLLAALATQLRAKGADIEELTSIDQPGLRLLIARGGVGDLEPLPAVRQWRFLVTR